MNNNLDEKQHMEARLYFCNRFSRMPKNPLRLLKEVLTTVKPGGLN